MKRFFVGLFAFFAVVSCITSVAAAPIPGIVDIVADVIKWCVTPTTANEGEDDLIAARNYLDTVWRLEDNTNGTVDVTYQTMSDMVSQLNMNGVPCKIKQLRGAGVTGYVIQGTGSTPILDGYGVYNLFGRYFTNTAGAIFRADTTSITDTDTSNILSELSYLEGYVVRFYNQFSQYYSFMTECMTHVVGDSLNDIVLSVNSLYSLSVERARDFDALLEKMDTVNTNLETITTKLTGLGEHLTAIDGNLVTFRENVNTRLDTIYNSGIKALGDNQVAILKYAIDIPAIKTLLTNVPDKLDTINNSVENVYARIDDLWFLVNSGTNRIVDLMTTRNIAIQSIGNYAASIGSSTHNISQFLTDNFSATITTETTVPGEPTTTTETVQETHELPSIYQEDESVTTVSGVLMDENVVSFSQTQTSGFPGGNTDNFICFSTSPVLYTGPVTYTYGTLGQSGSYSVTTQFDSASSHPLQANHSFDFCYGYSLVYYGQPSDTSVTICVKLRRFDNGELIIVDNLPVVLDASLWDNSLNAFVLPYLDDSYNIIYAYGTKDEPNGTVSASSPIKSITWQFGCRLGDFPDIPNVFTPTFLVYGWRAPDLKNNLDRLSGLYMYTEFPGNAYTVNKTVTTTIPGKPTTTTTTEIVPFTTYLERQVTRVVDAIGAIPGGAAPGSAVDLTGVITSINAVNTSVNSLNTGLSANLNSLVDKLQVVVDNSTSTVENTVINITEDNDAFNVFYIEGNDGNTQSVTKFAGDLTGASGKLLSLLYRLVFADALGGVDGDLDGFEDFFTSQEPVAAMQGMDDTVNEVVDVWAS